jgi:hypothetical protein
MSDHPRPIARLGERDFNLFYVARESARPNAKPDRIIGFVVAVHFGRRFRAHFRLSACTEAWNPVESLFVDQIEELLLIAEVFYKIAPRDWIGCHPIRGESLYKKKRTCVDRLHRTLLRKADFLRDRDTLAGWFCDKAWYMGGVANEPNWALNRKLVGHGGVNQTLPAGAG